MITGLPLASSHGTNSPRHRRHTSDPFDFDEPVFEAFTSDITRDDSQAMGDSPGMGGSPGMGSASWERDWDLQMCPASLEAGSLGDFDDGTAGLRTAVSGIQLEDVFGRNDATQNWAWTGEEAKGESHAVPLYGDDQRSTAGLEPGAWAGIGDPGAWQSCDSNSVCVAEGIVAYAEQTCSSSIPKPAQGVPPRGNTSPVFDGTHDRSLAAPTNATMASGMPAPEPEPAPDAPDPAPEYESPVARGGHKKRARSNSGFQQACRSNQRMAKSSKSGRSKAEKAMLQGPGKAQAAAAGHQLPALMEKPLPAEIAYRMLRDPNFTPGMRPPTFDDADGRWVFKEQAGARVGEPKSFARKDRTSDRWHNSGGIQGARDMPTAKPLVRRRYGSISRHKEILWRFHEYSVLQYIVDPNADSGHRYEEDRSTIVFHVMPKRLGRGRPSKAEAALPEQLWLSFMEQT